MITKLEQFNELKVNFHFTNNCQMGCKFCYAAKTNDDDKQNWIKIVEKLKDFKAINFVGGEPLIYFDDLITMAKIAKQNNQIISLVTNGTLLLEVKNETKVLELFKYLDLIGISIDSNRPFTNMQIGRWDRFSAKYQTETYDKILELINKHQLNLKINTVVFNTVVYSYNKTDYSVLKLVNKYKPSRWKILMVTDYAEIDNSKYMITKEQFANYVNKCQEEVFDKTILNPEDDELISNRYLMINNKGCFFRHQNNLLIESKSIVDNDLIDEFNSVSFDLDLHKKPKSINFYSKTICYI